MIGNINERIDVEADENWREICDQVPYISFRPDWKVKVIPPFGGAMARFVIEKNGKSVSVYYDTMDRLGFVGQPYFEAYPINNDAARFGHDEVDEMMKAIEVELNTSDF